jgi:hypothetical protein
VPDLFMWLVRLGLSETGTSHATRQGEREHPQQDEGSKPSSVHSAGPLLKEKHDTPFGCGSPYGVHTRGIT